MHLAIGYVGTKVKVQGGSDEASDVKVMEISVPVVLDVAAGTPASYVGASCTYTLTGLHTGESIAKFEVTTSGSVSTATYSGATLTVVPDRATTEYTVTTSEGRTKSFTVTAKVPKLKGHGTYFLRLDGTSQYPSASYIDPDTGAALATSTFDSDFYNAYMTFSYSLSATVGNSLVQYIGYLRAYSIDGFQSYADANNFDQVVATLTVKAKNLPAIESVKDDIKLEDPFPSKETHPTRLDVTSTVIGNGSMDRDYIDKAVKAANGGGSSAAGLTTRIDYTGNPVSWGRTVPADALTGFRTGSDAGVSVVAPSKTSDTAYSCMVLSVNTTAGIHEFTGWLQMGVKNSVSGKILYCPVVRFNKRIHLAIGGVKTAATYDNTARARQILDATLVDYPNDRYNFTRIGYFGGCDFAVRESNVGPATLQLMNSFRKGGPNAYRVRNTCGTANKATQISASGGTFLQFLALIPVGSAGNYVGVQNGYFSFVYYAVNASLSAFDFADPNGYGMANSQAPFTLATDYSGTRETYGIVLQGGDIIVHDFRKLYPDSHGWLRDTYNYTPVYPSSL